MAHRIESVKPLENFVVSVIFQNGIEKEYDVKILFSEYPQFLEVEHVTGLFEKVEVDVGGYGICWNDELDLDAEEIWCSGQETGRRFKVDVMSALGANLTEARNTVGMTQKELSEKVCMYQSDISKIERGIANPSVQTLQRLAEGMGMNLQIEFIPDQATTDDKLG